MDFPQHELWANMYRPLRGLSVNDFLKECSPRRQPWEIKEHINPSPGGAVDVFSFSLHRFVCYNPPQGGDGCELNSTEC